MGRQSKVLVADDDLFALQSIAKVLGGESYQVVTAASGSEALDLLRQDSFDLVLTDLKMPEVDGLEVLRQAKEIAPQAVVLILTGYASLESAIEALREGAYDYLVKPYSVDELRLKIERGLERVRLVEERQRAEEALRRERDLAEALEEVTAALTATLDFDQVLDRILEQVSRVVPNDATNIMLIEDDQVHIVRWRGYECFGEKEFVSTVVFRIPEVPGLQQMMESGEPMVIPDTATYPDWVRVPVTEWLRSYAAAPIVVRGEVIGFLNVDSTTPGFFTQAHAETLRAFADHAAAAIENARLYEAEQERRHIAETLRQASTVLSSTLELDEVLRLILQQLRQVIPYDSASVQRLQDAALSPSTEFIPSEAEGLRTGLVKGEHLKIVACQGFEEPDKVVDLVFPLDPKFPNYRVVTTKAPLAIQDVTQDYPHFKDEANTYESGRIRSWLGVPLMVKDEVIGMIAVDREEVHPYTAEESQLAMAFANQAAIAMENARLHEQTKQHTIELERRAKRLAVINRVSAAISSFLDWNEVLNTTVRELVGLFGVEHSGILIFDREKEWGYVLAEYPDWGATAEGFQVKGYLAAERIIADQKSLVIEDTLKDPLIAKVRDTVRRLGIKSMLIVPLVVRGETIGSIGLDAKKQHVFSQEEIGLARTIANQAAIAIENARLYEETKRRAITDGLTGLYNRRHFYELLEREVESVNRYDGHISLIMLDIDDFKVYNDTYGHLVGDALLRELAQLLTRDIRKVDIAARYGGDEFVILLSHTGKKQAVVLAERIRTSIEEYEFCGEEVLPTGEITISAGVATSTCPEDAVEPEVLMKAADMALLEAKKRGNRVCACGE